MRLTASNGEQKTLSMQAAPGTDECYITFVLNMSLLISVPTKWESYGYRSAGDASLDRMPVTGCSGVLLQVSCGCRASAFGPNRGANLQLQRVCSTLLVLLRQASRKRWVVWSSEFATHTHDFSKIVSCFSPLLSQVSMCRVYLLTLHVF